MRNSSSPSLIAPIALVIALSAFMAAALMNLGQPASNTAPVNASVASAELNARQG
jgi:hypothetical protein